MSPKKEDRLDRLERIVTEFIEESQAGRREMRQEMQLLSTAILHLAGLQIQDYNNSAHPVPAPSGSD